VGKRNIIESMIIFSKFFVEIDLTNLKSYQTQSKILSDYLEDFFFMTKKRACIY